MKLKFFDSTLLVIVVAILLFNPKLAECHDFGGPSVPGGPPGNALNRDKPRNQTAGGEISLFDGSESFTTVDLIVQGIFPIIISRTYNSRSTYDTPLGYGWDHQYNTRLFTYSDGSVVIRWNTGLKTRFVPSGGTFISTDNSPGKLVKNQDQSFTFYTPSGRRFHFDLRGCLDRVTDTNGNYLAFTYTTEKKPLVGKSPFSVDPSRSQIVSYEYRLTKVEEGTIDGLTGRFVNLSYDPTTGRLLSVTDFSGRTITYQHDSNGNLIRINYPKNLFHSFTYEDTNDTHNVTSFMKGYKSGDTDITTVLFKNTYDDQDRVIRQVHAGGSLEIEYTIPLAKTIVTRTIKNSEGTTLHNFQNTYEFNSSGYLIRYTDDKGNITEYSRDANNNVVRKTIWENTGTVSAPHLIKFSSVYYQYDASQKMVSTQITLDDGEILKWAFAYDHGWLQSCILSSSKFPGKVRSVIREFDYNNEGYPRYVKKQSILISNTVTPQYLSVQYEHNRYGQITAIVYDNGDRQEITYSNGFIIAVDGVEYVRSSDGRGYVVQVKDTTNKFSTINYDDLGRPVSITNPLGEQVILTYEGWNLTTIEKGKTSTLPGHKIFLSYDDFGRLISRTVDLDGTPSLGIYYSYDSADNLLSEKDAIGNEISYSYDSKNRLKLISYPHSQTLSYDYDVAGNIIKITDQSGNYIAYDYDKYNRIVKVSDTLGNSISYAHEFDNISKITDTNGNISYYHYDMAGRMISFTSPLNAKEYYEYDSKGRVSRKIDANGVQSDYVFDSQDRITKITIHSNPQRVLEFTYEDNNLHAYTDSAISSNPIYTYSYDALNRVIRCDNNLINKTLEYSYNRFGMRDGLTLRETNGAILFSYSYGYDSADRLTSITEQPSLEYTLGYDTLGRLATIEYPNGITASITYNDFARIQSLIYRKADQTAIETYQYQYNGMGIPNVTQDSSGTTNYTYDTTGRLLTASYPVSSGLTNESYTYDSLGNRLSSETFSDWRYNAINALTHYGNTDYTHDMKGNTLSKTTGTGITSYTFDSMDRLTRISSTGLSASYLYDLGNRRIQKNVNGNIKWFMYDGYLPLAEFDENGDLTRRYCFIPGSNTLLSLTDGNTHYHVLNDFLNVPRQIVDESQQIVWAANYQSFGSMYVNDDVDGDDNHVTLNLRFPGQYYDQESGLHYNFYRYYDPETGRFLSMDPVQKSVFSPDNLNRYIYAYNSPMLYIDPDGRENWWSNFAWYAFQEFTSPTRTWRNFSDAIRGKMGGTVQASAIVGTVFLATSGGYLFYASGAAAATGNILLSVGRGALSLGGRIALSGGRALAWTLRTSMSGLRVIYNSARVMGGYLTRRITTFYYSSFLPSLVLYGFRQPNGMPANVSDTVEDFGNLLVNTYGYLTGVDTGPPVTGDPHATSTIPGFLNTILFVIPYGLQDEGTETDGLWNAAGDAANWVINHVPPPPSRPFSTNPSSRGWAPTYVK
ncbi:MAG: hypothetical protein DRG83_02520 [Deltaproteobacteria bacterium]|nr:MAG: hypothetical protein DRG83_02520 [Deltaproteobacteria bacterium]